MTNGQACAEVFAFTANEGKLRESVGLERYGELDRNGYVEFMNTGRIAWYMERFEGGMYAVYAVSSLHTSDDDSCEDTKLSMELDDGFKAMRTKLTPFASNMASWRVKGGVKR